jgi:thioredoxin reductase (NADPH)
MLSDVCIIGAGPIGLFSVFSCGMKGLSCTVIDALPYPGGQCASLYPEKPIYDIPAYTSLTGQSLVDALLEQISPFKPYMALGQRVTHLNRGDGGFFYLGTNHALENHEYTCRAVIIAAGAGCFEPNKPDIENIEFFEPGGVAYRVQHKELYRDKTVVIMGGGDSAADWAIELSSLCSHVHLVHRRDKLRTHHKNQQDIEHAQLKGTLTFWPSTEIKCLEGNAASLTKVMLVTKTGDYELAADHLLAFLGLTADLSDILQWGIPLSQNRIPVSDFGSCETSERGIYAVGDMADYPHKRRLIMTGFAEAEQAAHHIYRTLHPDKRSDTQHSTTTGIIKF